MLSVMVTVIGRLAPLASVDRQVVVAPTRMGTCWGQVVVVLRPRLANCWLIVRSTPPAMRLVGWMWTLPLASRWVMVNGSVSPVDRVTWQTVTRPFLSLTFFGHLTQAT